MASVPLSDRDVNAHLKNTTNNVSDQKPTKTSEGDNKPFPAHMRAKSGDTISPSDAIQSPASQKLAGMKGRKFASAKPRSLFGKTVTPSQAEEQVAKDETQPAEGEIKDHTVL